MSRSLRSTATAYGLMTPGPWSMVWPPVTRAGLTPREVSELAVISRNSGPVRPPPVRQRPSATPATPGPTRGSPAITTRCPLRVPTRGVLEDQARCRAGNLFTHADGVGHEFTQRLRVAHGDMHKEVAITGKKVHVARRRE